MCKENSTGIPFAIFLQSGKLLIFIKFETTVLCNNVDGKKTIFVTQSSYFVMEFIAHFSDKCSKKIELKFTLSLLPVDCETRAKNKTRKKYFK